MLMTMSLIGWETVKTQQKLLFVEEKSVATKKVMYRSLENLFDYVY